MLKVAIMLCSPQKYLFSIEIEISAIVLTSSLAEWLNGLNGYFDRYFFHCKLWNLGHSRIWLPQLSSFQLRILIRLVDLQGKARPNQARQQLLG